MANHTPGPWVSLPTYVGKDGYSKGGYEVKTVAGESVTGWGRVTQTEANARLIAAAPEMLEVLIELQESAQYWSEYDVPIGIVDRLNVVISKAKGEE